jgi:hypothetical protein
LYPLNVDAMKVAPARVEALDAVEFISDRVGYAAVEQVWPEPLVVVQ